MRKTILIVVLVATLVACNNSRNQKVPAETETTEQKTEAISYSTQLYEKEWRLSELNGKAIVLDTTFQKYPHLIFQEENRISGNLGCNGFGANIELKADNKIKISDITSTEMACPNLEVEQGFLDALNNAKSYAVQNNVLTLSNNKNEITAKLEVKTK